MIKYQYALGTGVWGPCNTKEAFKGYSRLQYHHVVSYAGVVPEAQS
jgi:hypothetical protein